MIKISLLGTTKVEVDGVVVPEASLGGRLRQVLEILALNAGKSVPKEVLADHIWEGSPPATYVGTLESYVCVLRKRLGLVGGRRSALSTRDRGYVLEGDDVRVDVDLFRVGQVFFLYNDGYWYRSDRWSGDFVAISDTRLPRDFRMIPRSEWRHGPPPWANARANRNPSYR